VPLFFFLAAGPFFDIVDLAARRMMFRMPAVSSPCLFFRRLLRGKFSDVTTPFHSSCSLFRLALRLDQAMVIFFLSPLSCASLLSPCASHRSVPPHQLPTPSSRKYTFLILVVFLRAIPFSIFPGPRFFLGATVFGTLAFLSLQHPFFFSASALSLLQNLPSGSTGLVVP